MKIHDFKKYKINKKSIAMVTCYDAWSAHLIAKSNIDCVLVGDSLGMVMNGHSSTIPVTVDHIKYHTEAVMRTIGNQFVVADLPFLSYRKDLKSCMDAVQSLMQTGPHAVKLEGISGNEKLIHHIVESGVPVMAHLGLTPQSAHQLGGFKVQGKNEACRSQLICDALKAQDLGCFAIVLECIPSDLAKEITNQLEIPTIGIGAGPHTSGQVLVLQDMLGFSSGFQPKFLKRFLDGDQLIQEALNTYQKSIQPGGDFPAPEHCY